MKINITPDSVLKITDNFLPDDILMDEDLRLIELAEREYANRETPDWSDVEWK